ncbi:NAD(P)-binding domain-containing protein [Shimia sp. MMG029]|uniref:NAD(P)-binding domain-containing protein n=1 Tax=Shimia sp. MMG029 TaxID=3021978 RepID=UPI0022FE283A|nr:NAD(P)-binding domain-containing protein [Shimia sp. MMG029]MDA5558566.1 NAD(P)-binding domain-containing protein [Shimia sp. MMG029]
MKIGYLGFGTIALACAQGLVEDGHDIIVSERSKTNATRMSERHGNVRVASNQALLDTCDVVFLGTTAEVADALLEDLAFRENQTVLSFMVGMPAEKIAKLVAPATFEAIVIPFPSIAQGGSPLLTYPKSPTTETLYGRANTIIPMKSEADFNEFLAAQALLSVVAKLMAVSVDWLSEKTEDPVAAEQFLRLLIGGSIMAEPITTPNVMSNLVSSLNTPGGLNQQLREFMADTGTYDELIDGLNVLSARLNRS